MDPRISVSGLCFLELPLPAVVVELQRLGARTTTLIAGGVKAFGVDRTQDLLASSGIAVAGLIGTLPRHLADPQTWEASRSALIEDLDAAVLLGAPAVYTVTGPLIDGDESASFEAFGRFIEPVVAHAREVGVALAIEPTLPVYASFSFTHTLESALRLASQCDIGICLDVFHIWDDPDLSRALKDSMDRVVLVQIGDSTLDADGNRQKQIPGIGSVPMADLIAQIIDAGYRGPFDLEIDGPFIDAVGSSVAAERAVAFLDRTLSAVSLTDQR